MDLKMANSNSQSDIILNISIVPGVLMFDMKYH